MFLRLQESEENRVKYAISSYFDRNFYLFLVPSVKRDCRNSLRQFPTTYIKATNVGLRVKAQ